MFVLLLIFNLKLRILSAPQAPTQNYLSKIFKISLLQILTFYRKFTICMMSVTEKSQYVEKPLSLEFSEENDLIKYISEQKRNKIIKKFLP